MQRAKRAKVSGEHSEPKEGCLFALFALSACGNSRSETEASILAQPHLLLLLLIIIALPVGTDTLNLSNVGLKVSHRRGHVQIYTQLRQSGPCNVVGRGEGGGDQVGGGEGEIVALESSDTAKSGFILKLDCFRVSIWLSVML